MAINEPHEVSPEARERVTQLLMQLKGEQVSRWVMEEVFSPEEREIAYEYAQKMLKHPGKRSTKQTSQRSDHPHGDRPFLPNAINMFAHVRQLDPVVATLDLGYLGDRLTPQQYHKLRREIGIDQLDYGVELRRAIEEADLVVHEFWRMVVWRTVQIDVDFEHEGKSWEYFWRLASAARNGCSIGPEDFSSETQPRSLADWKSRLGKLDGFPVELWDLIVVKGGRHRLKLPPKKIRVFRMKPPAISFRHSVSHER